MIRLAGAMIGPMLESMERAEDMMEPDPVGTASVQVKLPKDWRAGR